MVHLGDGMPPVQLPNKQQAVLVSADQHAVPHPPHCLLVTPAHVSASRTAGLLLQGLSQWQPGHTYVCPFSLGCLLNLGFSRTSCPRASSPPSKTCSIDTYISDDVVLFTQHPTLLCPRPWQCKVGACKTTTPVHLSSAHTLGSQAAFAYKLQERGYRV